MTVMNIHDWHRERKTTTRHDLPAAEPASARAGRNSFIMMDILTVRVSKVITVTQLCRFRRLELMRIDTLEEN